MLSGSETSDLPRSCEIVGQATIDLYRALGVERQVGEQIMPIILGDENEILNISEWQGVEIEVTLDSGAC